MLPWKLTYCTSYSDLCRFFLLFFQSLPQSLDQSALMRIAQLHKLIDVAINFNLAVHIAANGFSLHVKLILFLTSVENKDRSVDSREGPGEGE